MKYIISFAASFLAAAAILSLAPVHGETEIYDNVLRLHVIAESDSDEDQALKLKVRDAVLTCLSDGLEDCTSFEEAYRTVDGMRDTIISAAEDCVCGNGASCSVSVELGREKYPTRDYGTASLPAGVYNSLRVVLGDGAGKNWWCVLFPTICTGFASSSDTAADEYAAVGFTPEEYRIITGDSGEIRVKFRILEIISELADGIFGGK